MKKILHLLLTTFCILGTVHAVYGERVPERYLTKSAPETKATTAGCNPGAGFQMLEVNNVRSRVNTSGDMWQNFATGIAQYFIPANTTKTSLFAGALWIGGVDVNGQLKLAAQRFRQLGVDYWPGPLTIDGTASISELECVEWDRMYHITKAEVEEYRGYWFSENKNEEYPGYTVPESIEDWPAVNNNPGKAYYLAPFYDVNGDGIYNPDPNDDTGGDYPYYDFDNVLCPLNYVDSFRWTPKKTLGSEDFRWDGSVNPYKTETGGILSDQVIKGDETYWWVFNDKGNAHGETKGQPIGLEIRAQAFGFATNDEINNMTFFSYEIINRSTFTLTNTYFAPWTDPDLGYAKDDYVGCDVERGMGYCYNGSNTDGTGQSEAYGESPPAVGIDFFQGPYLDPDGYDNPGYTSKPTKGPSFANVDNKCEIVSGNNQLRTMAYGGKNYDSISKPTMVRAEAINGVNFGNGILNDERFGMRRFVYHENNDNNVIGDPSLAPEYYLFLRGIWKNGAKMTYGGNGTTGTIATDFMFPELSDPCHWGTNGTDPGTIWTEHAIDNIPGNTAGDRRFMQSAGPFTLSPGAVNYITFGVPWARASVGQDAWESVVKLQDADDKCQALFNNCFKVLDGPDAPDLSFVELDQKLIVHLVNKRLSNNFDERYQELDNTVIRGDSLYRFEGYQIYQLLNNTIGPEDLADESKARLVAQYDITNGIARVINFEADPITGYDIPLLKVNGQDKGISHTFEITDDKFARSDNKTLINNKKYYYIAIAYAYNNYMTFDPNNSIEGGQKYPYLSGRKNIKVAEALPHKTMNGVILHSDYGNMPPITRMAGKGNGGVWLELNDSLKRVLLSKPPIKDGILYGHPDYPILYNPTYNPNSGPVKVKVIDPLNVKAGDYQIVFYACHETYNEMRPVTDLTYAAYIDQGKWKLIDKETGKPYDMDTTISVISIRKSDQEIDQIYSSNNEYLFLGSGAGSAGNLGISITISQTFQPGDYWMRTRGNGFLGYSATFADSSVKWLSGIADQDIPGSPLNWIRSGGYYETGQEADKSNSDYNVINYTQSAENPQDKLNRMMDAWDPQQNYEKIFNGTWAPYTVCATAGIGGNEVGPLIEQSKYGPAAAKQHKPKNFMTSMGSVDIVLTADKNLWTRCVVAEMGWMPPFNEGTALPFNPRKSPSVDKEGNPATGAQLDKASANENDPNYISPTGMGWFPGYAINLDTGERLNVIFGENSYFGTHNGHDMLFNPTSVIADAGGYYMGGMHYVYVMGHKVVYFINSPDPNKNKGTELPAYDAGAKYMDLFNSKDAFMRQNARVFVYSACMYVGMPIPAIGHEDVWEKWTKNQPNNYSDFTLKIRVAKPYARYSSEMLNNSFMASGSVKIPTDPNYISMNDEWPMYEFSTKSMEPEYDNPQKEKSDLELIAVIPNPYYAYSNYEQNATDNRVRIANLPKTCTVTIYNIGGTMIRQFKKDDATTYFDWDLKNFAGIPIAGGPYIVHIKSPAGEKVIKWFGVIRTVDLFTF